MRFDNALICLVFMLVGFGCTTLHVRQSKDIRHTLLESAKANDPDFPDGDNVRLTHFSHVGEVITGAREQIFVVDSRAVLTGMLAPHGQNAIMFFDHEFRYLGKIGYVSSRPLWCDGGRVYLFGELDGFATALSGNVIDLSDGYQNLMAYHEHAYGSSGGIEE